jgi:integrase/recombinase XerD
MPTATVGAVLYAFFEDYLKCQKGLSTASIRSYRDGMRLCLHFVAQDTKRAISRLTLADVRAERVRRFLSPLEAERANHIRTRNQRLSALRVFFD